MLAAGWEPPRETALEIMRHAREHLAPYKRVRRIEFADLPKTISGKIRRVELRALEEQRFATGVVVRAATEFWEQDFPELHKLMPPLGVLQDRGLQVALVTDGRLSGASGKVPAANLPASATGVPVPTVVNGQWLKGVGGALAFYLVARECQEENAFYNPANWRIDICYEMIELIEKVAPPPNAPVDGFTRDEVVVGAFVGVIIHEVGHAAFDMFNVPVFGREEDAADEMAGFLAVQFNKQVAHTVTRGFAFLWRAAGRLGGEPKDWAEYADEHGAEAARTRVHRRGQGPGARFPQTAI